MEVRPAIASACWALRSDCRFLASFSPCSLRDEKKEEK
jgi:hypothetical protein